LKDEMANLIEKYDLNQEVPEEFETKI